MPKKSKKQSRVDVSDLEKKTKKLSKREQKNVKGGLLGTQLVSTTIGGALAGNTIGGALNTVGGALNTVGGALGNTVGGSFGPRNP
jgi:hypothetical protein